MMIRGINKSTQMWRKNNGKIKVENILKYDEKLSRNYESKNGFKVIERKRKKQTFRYKRISFLRKKKRIIGKQLLKDKWKKKKE